MVQEETVQASEEPRERDSREEPKMSRITPPLNFARIDEHRHLLKPPVGNQVTDTEFR